MDNQVRWLSVMGKLNVSRSKSGPAPHKPLLLLVLLELSEKGELPARVIQLTPELAFRFFSFWSIVAHRRTQPPDVRLPFYHLQTDGFWSARRADSVPSDGPRSTRYAVLDSGFEVAIGDPDFRRQARSILVAKYFEPGEQLSLRTLLGMAEPDGQSNLAGSLSAEQSEVEKSRGRSARFRLDVVSSYHYTCALTGHRLTTLTVGSLVDAAHIRQFAHSGCNEITNGMALSKNAHWAFDAGLWSVTDDYRVLVALKNFAEECPNGQLLKDYQGQTIRLPEKRGHWPSPIHLRWHRRHHNFNIDDNGNLIEVD